MYTIFLNNECLSGEFDEFSKQFRDGEVLGVAKFEFHNDSSFRIYIENENDDKNIMLNFDRTNFV